VSAIAPSPRWNEVDEVNLEQIDGEKVQGTITS